MTWRGLTAAEIARKWPDARPPIVAAYANVDDNLDSPGWCESCFVLFEGGGLEIAVDVDERGLELLEAAISHLRPPKVDTCPGFTS